MRNWMIGPIFIGVVLLWADRINISVAAPVFLKQFGWNAATFGIIMSAFSFGYFLFQIPGGWLADKLGGPRSLKYSVASFSVFTLLTPLTSMSGIMSLVRALVGASESPLNPSATVIISKYFKAQARARIQGFLQSGSCFGPIIALPLSAWLIHSYGWQSVFYVFGVLGILWAVWWQFIGPKQQASTNENINKQKTPIWSVLTHNRTVWLLVVAFFAFPYANFLFLNWLPTYLVNVRHFTIVKVGIFGMLPYIGGFIAMNLSGMLVDAAVRKGKNRIAVHKLNICITSCIYIIAAILAVTASSSIASLVWITIAVTFLSANFQSFWVLPIEIDAERAGTLSALMNTGGQLGALLSPLITGFLVQYTHQFQMAFYLSALLIFISICIVGFGIPSSRKASIEAVSSEASH